jgi:PhzF family phenazine biosynthesis protein
MPIPLLQVDAFTDRPFSGNPAAVCLLREPQADDWMQAVAAEMNLSETAFLVRENGGYRLRWFTPKVEVELCGHATLASAHVLWTEEHVPLDKPILFHTRSGLLKAVRRGELIELDFPSDPSNGLRVHLESTDIIN